MYDWGNASGETDRDGTMGLGGGLDKIGKAISLAVIGVRAGGGDFGLRGNMVKRRKVVPKTKLGRVLHKVAKHAAKPVVLEVTLAFAIDYLKASTLLGGTLMVCYGVMVYFFGHEEG